MSGDEPNPSECGSRRFSFVDVAPNWIGQMRELGVWLYPALVGFVYVLGFVILNANLAKYGVLDVEFVNARYFLSGLCFVLCLVCFYAFAGRSIINMPFLLGEDLNFLNKSCHRPIASFLLFIHSLVSVVFFLCLSTALFSWIAIPDGRFAAVNVALIFSFVILYPLDVLDVDKKFFAMCNLVQLLLKSGAIYIFCIC